MNLLALTVLAVLSLAGVIMACLGGFGTLLILIAAVLYAMLTGFAVVNAQTLIVLLIWYLCGEILEFLLTIIAGKQFGASNAAVAGALIGGILGALAGLYLFGIGVMLGLSAGVFIGAFLVEWSLKRDLAQALKSGAATLLGRIGAMISKVAIALIMLLILVSQLLQNFRL